MDNSLTSTLSNALNFGSARLEAISNNLSNVNTPGYKRKDVSFSDLLSSVSGQSNHLTMATSSPLDLSPSSSAPPTPTVLTQGGTSMRADGNNVDIDLESSRLAAAQIFYEGTAQLLQGHFAALKYVIAGV